MRQTKQNSLASDPQPKKKHYEWIIALVCVLILALILVVGYFTIHIWTEPTCINPAICQICGTSEGKRAGHNWLDATCEKPQTCAACGKETGEPLGHIWLDATCEKPKTCSVCSAETGELAAHDWQDATCIIPKVCSACGAETGDLGDHDWQDATCITPKICSVCSAETGGLGDHIWKDATYNDPRTCTLCGETEGATKSPTASLRLRDIVSSESASSVYSGDKLGTHGPENLYDGSLKTNWTENAYGIGVGEYVIFYFDDTYAVKEFRIYIGSHLDRKVYKQSCRPAEITLTFSDGSTERIPLADSYEEQLITLDQYHYTDYVKITISRVYVGTLFEDTVIAELDFVVYRP